jgi:peptide/nickel transport system substrate-binding protein
MDSVWIGVLGPLSVRVDGQGLTIGSAKQRALLALLALHRGQCVSAETLIAQLWDGSPPATAGKILQGYVSKLRKAIGLGVLETSAGGYRLHLAAEDLDAARFQSLLEVGGARLRAGEPDAARTVLHEALGLWRGECLTEFRGLAYVGDEATRLEELRLLGLEYRLEADLRCGDHVAVVPELQTLIRVHPFREDLRGLLMLALYRAGRQVDALAAYREARAIMVAELGVDPSRSLGRLQTAILTHDSSLDLHPNEAASGRPGGTSAEPGPPEKRSPDEVPATQATPADVAPAPLTPGSDWDAPVRPQVRRSRRLLSSLVCGAVVAAAGLFGFGVHPVPPSESADASPDYVGFVDSTGIQQGDVALLLGSPTAAASDGAGVWAVVPAANAVVRVDRSARAIVQTTMVGRDPSGVAVGGGSIWVANHADNTVSRLSAQTGAVVQTIRVGAGPSAVIEGFGSIWVTNSGDRTLGRIDESSGTVAATIRTDAVGRGVAVGGGAVWETDESAGRIVAVDPATNAVETRVNVGGGPTAITYGDGAVWVVNSLDGTVSRYDKTQASVTSTVTIPGDPVAIAFGGDAVWVGTATGSRLVRLGAGGGTVGGPITIRGRVHALAATDSGVWVAAGAAGVSHRGGRLVVMGGVSSIDPSAGDGFPSPLDLSYDTLTGLRSSGGSAGTQLVPDLATSLPAPAADGLSYTFRLRPGVKYANGRALQPADFRRGLVRLLVLNKNAGWNLSHVVGAPACSRGDSCNMLAGVQTTGTTVAFHLSSVDPRFLEELALLVPVPAGTPLHDVGTIPVPGTGPYAIRSFVPDRTLVFGRNPYFHSWSSAARPDGYPDEIDFEAASGPEDAVRRVKAGRADLVQLLAATADERALASDHPAQVHTEDQQAVVFLFLNTRRAPFDDVRVRQALNYAVDRERVAGLSGAALAQPTCQVIPPTTTGFRPYCPYTAGAGTAGRWRAPDLHRARQLIDASGTRGEAVTVWTPPDFLAEARYLSSLLTQLGFRSNVHEVRSDYFAVLDTHSDAQAGMYGWFDTPLAVDALSVLTCSFDPNPAHFCDRRIDAQVAELARTEPTDPSQAEALAATVDREVTDQAPWVALFTPQTVDVTSVRVGNVQAERGHLLIDQLWVQ